MQRMSKATVRPAKSGSLSGKLRAADVKTYARRFCGGYLFAKGICVFSRTAGWNMPAMLGTAEGIVYALLLFWLGCTAVFAARRSAGEKGAAAAQTAACVAYFASFIGGGMVKAPSGMIAAAVFDTAVLLLPFALCGKRNRSGVPLAAALLALRAAFALTPCGAQIIERLRAVLLGLAASGFVGTYLCSCKEESRDDPVSLLGIVAAVVICQLL